MAISGHAIPDRDPGLSVKNSREEATENHTKNLMVQGERKRGSKYQLLKLSAGPTLTSSITPVCPLPMVKVT